MKWDKLKEQEAEYLKAQKLAYPELFKKASWIENADFLRSFGIYIPGKEHCTTGYLKLLPQDFIVEEIDIHGVRHTIGTENILSETTTIEIEPGSQTIYATLVKCGLSTIEVVDEICKQLDCKKECIQYAGIKDKRAITAQGVSFRNISLEQLRSLKSDNFFLKNVRSGKGVVEKGRLRSNTFTIYVRTPRGAFENETVKNNIITTVEKIVHEGFYNFYYLQRFAMPRLMNPEWGLNMIKGDYRSVIKSFLTDRSDRETGFFTNIRAEIEKNLGNWDAVIKILEPLPSFRYERMLVEALKNKPGDYVGALNAISDQITLWVYGFASMLFNEKISSFLENGQVPPRELPTVISSRSEDVAVYEDLLRKIGMFPLDLRNIRPFPTIQIRGQKTPTIAAIEIHGIEILNTGMVLHFTLEKGEYATTFLSHIFNLANGNPSEDISVESCDIQAAISNSNGSQIAKTAALDYFKKTIDSMTETEG